MISIFDLFKIGIGPSSSHTVGPMRAARMFLEEMDSGNLEQVAAIKVELYGSLAFTGKGHGTDRAILLGLLGEKPEEVDPAGVERELAAVHASQTISLLRRHPVAFHADRDLLFHTAEVLPLHSNGMRFTVYDSGHNKLNQEIYYSVGGGFVVKHGAARLKTHEVEVPFPFSHGEDLLLLGGRSGKSIAEMAFANETCWRTEEQIHCQIRKIWKVMQLCVQRGLVNEGELPGGLNVQRRAPRLQNMLVKANSDDPLDIMDWVNVYAIAVNEENAAGGQVVTAPTNGAAGIIPAVLHYYQNFCKGASEEGIERFLLTAGVIGILYKENASISGAEVGCQGEVGVACSMAAAGLVAAPRRH